jgi:hydroxyacylglutathione hydrolase
MTIRLQALPAFSDNYIWLLINEQAGAAAIIDPGTAEVCESFLAQEKLDLAAILITHHHWDHVSGIEKLAKHRDIPVFGPAAEHISGVNRALIGGDRFSLPAMDLAFDVLDLSGHTAGHIGYLTENILFCGDTLFSAGCGRLFDGTATQLHNSLNRIRQLPAETVICCAHEYTRDNLHFAQVVEPDNPAISQRLEEVESLRARKLPTLPVTLAMEQRYNPFLRTDRERIMSAVAAHSGMRIENSEDCFRYLRMWKDGF